MLPPRLLSLDPSRGLEEKAGALSFKTHQEIWADGAYSGEELVRWCEERGGWKLEIVERTREAEGFEVLPKR